MLFALQSFIRLYCLCSSRQQGTYYTDVVTRYYQSSSCCSGYSGIAPYYCYRMCLSNFLIACMHMNYVIFNSAICSQGCFHGSCTSPGYCSCDSGWTGTACNEGTLAFSFTYYCISKQKNNCMFFYHNNYRYQWMWHWQWRLQSQLHKHCWQFCLFMQQRIWTDWWSKDLYRLGVRDKILYKQTCSTYMVWYLIAYPQASKHHIITTQIIL